MNGMGSHQSHGKAKKVWLTPPNIIAALGPFDLDPCFGEPRPWLTAAHHYGPEDNGLMKRWHGFVWCNPPYDDDTWAWLGRMADHGNGIALVFARTEVEGFHRTVWDRAHALRFLEGRLFFHRPDGERGEANGGAPSVLIAYGEEAARRLESAEIERWAGARRGMVPASGRFIRLNQ